MLYGGGRGAVGRVLWLSPLTPKHTLVVQQKRGKVGLSSEPLGLRLPPCPTPTPNLSNSSFQPPHLYLRPRTEARGELLVK